MWMYQFGVSVVLNLADFGWGEHVESISLHTVKTRTLTLFSDGWGMEELKIQEKLGKWHWEAVN